MKKDYNHFNSAPEGLKIITKEEWRQGLFGYQTGCKELRQIRGNDEGVYFNLIMFAVPNFENKKLGYAVMEDWWDANRQRNRKKTITRFCRYGVNEDWFKFEAKYNAQFAHDNS